MTCRLICQTVRTYGYKSNAKCPILFLQLFTVIPTKKFQNKICDRISSLESNKSSYVICVDINTNTLENTNKTIDYINALTSIGCKTTI